MCVAVKVCNFFFLRCFNSFAHNSLIVVAHIDWTILISIIRPLLRLHWNCAAVDDAQFNDAIDFLSANKLLLLESTIEMCIADDVNSWKNFPINGGSFPRSLYSDRTIHCDSDMLLILKRKKNREKYLVSEFWCRYSFLLEKEKRNCGQISQKTIIKTAWETWRCSTINKQVSGDCCHASLLMTFLLECCMYEPATNSINCKWLVKIQGKTNRHFISIY